MLFLIARIILSTSDALFGRAGFSLPLMSLLFNILFSRSKTCSVFLDCAKHHCHQHLPARTGIPHSESQAHGIENIYI